MIIIIVLLKKSVSTLLSKDLIQILSIPFLLFAIWLMAQKRPLYTFGIIVGSLIKLLFDSIGRFIGLSNEKDDKQSYQKEDVIKNVRKVDISNQNANKVIAVKEKVSNVEYEKHSEMNHISEIKNRDIVKEKNSVYDWLKHLFFIFSIVSCFLLSFVYNGWFFLLFIILTGGWIFASLDD